MAGNDPAGTETETLYDSLAPASLSERNEASTSLLDASVEHSASRSIIAGTCAALLHGLIALLALTVGARVTRQVTHVDVSELIEVELSPEREQASRDDVKEEAVEEEPEVVEERKKPLQEAVSHKEPESLDPSAEAEDEPPPVPAEAGEVLTAEEQVLDFGDTLISGTGNRFAAGVTAADGSSKKALRNSNARPGGVVGGTGNGKTARAEKPVDLSRSPRLAGNMQWDCPFPPEADMEQINSATVGLSVQVDPNGHVNHVSVVSDPGFGFGRVAQRCAVRKRWDPGLDAEGQAIRGTARVKVRFQR